MDIENCTKCNTLINKYTLYKNLCEGCNNNLDVNERIVESFTFNKMISKYIDCCRYFTFSKNMCACCIHYMNATDLEVEKNCIENYFIEHPQLKQLLKERVFYKKDYIDLCNCTGPTMKYDELEDAIIESPCECGIKVTYTPIKDKLFN